MRNVPSSSLIWKEDAGSFIPCRGSLLLIGSLSLTSVCVREADGRVESIE